MNISLKTNMTQKLITVSKSESVEQALMIMKNHHFRHLPVIDEANKIVGIVSDRDLYYSLNSSDIEIGAIMKSNLYIFNVQTAMKTVVGAMIKQKISAFLVEEDKEIIGIITSEDLLQLLAHLLNDHELESSLLADFLQTAKMVADSVRNPNIIT